MKIKILSILVVFVIAVILPIACNADKGQTGDKKSEATVNSYNPGDKKSEAIVNSDNPGEEMDITKHLVKGKTNIVDFYSEYCPPCRRISPALSKLDKKRDDIVVIKVDINRSGTRGIDWRSPLARQYELTQIPHFKIYDGKGKKVLEGQEAGQKVYAYLDEAGIQIN